MSRPRSNFIAVTAVAAVLVLLTVAAFQGVRSAGFVGFDDDDYVSANPHVKAGLTSRSIAWAMTTTDAANWHPLTWISHMADVSWFGMDAGRHHGTSVLLHSVNVLLLFFLFRRMTGDLWPSAAVAALFAIHPLHVESVAWLAERKDVLSTLFWLLTTLAWLRFLERRTVARYAGVTILYACGLMSKPMLVTLPFTLLLLDVWPLARGVRWKEKMPLFVLAAASCAVTFVAQRHGGAVQSLVSFPLSDRVANAIHAYADYLWKTVRPAGLAAFYPYPEQRLPMTLVAPAACALAAITALALRSSKRAPYLLVGWLWYAGTLVPVIGLVQIGSQSMADRYTYVPLIGIFFAAAWGAADLVVRWPRLKPVVAAASVAIGVALLLAARAQVAYWKDAVTLFGHAISVTRDNWLAHGNLGGALLSVGRLDEAIAEERAALAIRPDYAQAHCNLGLALVHSGRPNEALPEFERAVALNPNFAKAHNNLAGVLAGQGRIDESIGHLEAALRSDPDDADAHENLASLLMSRGRYREAASHLETAVRLRPADAQARAHLEQARRAAGASP